MKTLAESVGVTAPLYRPKVSIVIDNYNYARFLRAAIDSALSQTYANCEVIVVDDGSTDDSRQVIGSYGKSVRAIYKVNGGQGSALNTGFAASDGDLIIFLDADDVLLPTAAETVLPEMRGGVALIRYPLEVIYADGDPSGRYVGKSPVTTALFGPFGADSPGSANAFPREVLKRIMPVPEEDWPICADAFLAVLSSVLGKVVCLDQPLGKYRIHGSNHFAGAKGGLAQMRRGVLCDFSLYLALQKLAHDEIGPRDKWLGRYPQHWVNRIGSLRESPADHPWDDRLLKLLGRAVSATWRQPFWNLRRKFAYSLWVVAYGTFPIKVARALRDAEGRGARSLPQFLVGR